MPNFRIVPQMSVSQVTQIICIDPKDLKNIQVVFRNSKVIGLTTMFEIGN